MNDFYWAQWILRAFPSLEFDLEQVERPLLQRGTIDQIANALESQGSGSSLTIRTNTLVTVAAQWLSGYDTPYEIVDPLVHQDRRLSAWILREWTRWMVEQASVSRPRMLSFLSLLDAFFENRERDYLGLAHASRACDRTKREGTMLEEQILASMVGSCMKSVMWSFGTIWEEPALLQSYCDVIRDFSSFRRERDDAEFFREDVLYRSMVRWIAERLPSYPKAPYGSYYG